MNWSRKSRIIILIVAVVLGSVLQSWHFLKTGWETSRGIEFSELHDSLWHLALIKEISRGLPLENPGISGEKLTNYHYLSDVFLYIIQQGTHLSVETVYFHLAPPLVSALFILSLYLFSEALTGSFSKAIAAVIFTLFSGSAGFLIPLFKGPGANWYANSFMLDQPFDQLSNVHSLLGWSIFMFGSYFTLRYLREKKKKYG